MTRQRRLGSAEARGTSAVLGRAARIRSWRGVRAGAVAVAVLAASLVPIREAAAAGDGGASSWVTRDGRIVTSIVLPGSGRTTRGAPGPDTYWLTLSDADVSFLLQVAAADPELAEAPLLRVLEPLLLDGTAADVDIQVLVRGGALTPQVRAVPGAATTARALARQMITALPTLPVTISPPPGAPVPLYEPVFLSFDPVAWDTTVDRSLTWAGITARVRARPVAVRVSSGDPTQVGRVTRCDGPGRPYDPTKGESAAHQARGTGACSISYDTATGVRGRRDRWLGDVTVVWRAEWTTDGITWRALGDIPKVSLISRRVRSVTTAIESTR